MTNEKVYSMPFGRVYACLIAKVERKGRTRAELDCATQWLTGYAPAEIRRCMEDGTTYGDFFRRAPGMNPNRSRIRGVVCGVRVEEIQEPLMREIRYLDKLTDELAKGRPLEKILRSE